MMRDIGRNLMQHISFRLICIVLFFQTNTVFASDTIGPIKILEHQYECHVNSGYINYASLDNLYADNVYSGGNAIYEITFGIHSKIHVETAAMFSIFERKPKSLTIDPTIISSDDRLNAINHLHFELNNSCRFLLFKNRSQCINFYISGDWLTTGDYIINNFMDPELLISSICPGCYVEYDSKGLLLYTQLKSPLLSYTCRNNYSFSRSSDYEEFNAFDFLMENSRIQFPNSLFAFFIHAGCRLTLSKHVGMQLEYHFRYLKDSEPRILKAITSIYSVGFFYRVTR